MKKILCKEITGPNGPMGDCEHEFHAQTFEQLIEAVKDHIIRDPKHEADLHAMESSTEEQRQQWIDSVQRVWDSKPEA